LTTRFPFSKTIFDFMPAFGMSGRLGLAGLCAALILSGCTPDKPTKPTAPDVQIAKPATVEKPDTLIKRATLFGHPAQYQGRISPDGAKVSWLAQSDGALNLFVADADGNTPPKQYTFGKDGVEIHHWTPNSAYILYARTFASSKTTRTYALNVQTGEVRDLVPVDDGDYVWPQEVSKNWPNTALIRMRKAGEKAFNLYRVNLENGEQKLIAKNPGYGYLVTDSDFIPRIGIQKNPDGSQTWVALGPNTPPMPLFTVAPEDVARTRPQQMDATSTSFYLIDGRNREFAQFTRIDLQTGETEILASDQANDIEATLFHPITAAPLAYFTNGDRPHWQSLSADFQPVLDKLERALGPRFFILAATNTAQQLIVYSDRPNHPGIYSFYDLETDKITTLFETMPELERHNLSNSRMMRIKARDGFELISYFTPAQTKDPKHAPLVVMPQNWIKSRMVYGFDARIQWLSNRGYNVLEVNTRGAYGLGRSYYEAGIGKAIALAKADLNDAISGIIHRGLADKTRIAGIGADNGARTILRYAAMADAKLRCIVVIDPLLDVNSTLGNSKETSVRDWLGPLAMPQNRDLLDALSPARHSKSITANTLVLQSNSNAKLDVNIARSFVKDVRESGGKAALVYFPEVKKNPFNNKAFIPFSAIAESFLGTCLGGKAESIGNTLDDMTFELNTGPDGLPGLDLH
jgi:dipeptidyl aminopeptidase/acylaminoacyl peptidase